VGSGRTDAGAHAWGQVIAFSTESVLAPDVLCRAINAHLPGYDYVLQGVGGIMSVTGDEDGPPVKVGVAIVDLTAGMFALSAILAAEHRDIGMTLEWMDAIGVDYCCLFPTPMLFLGLHPQVEVEVAMCRAYNRWLCERILKAEPRIVSMLYLPFNDPDAAYRTVKDFGDEKGVVGFMVTSPRYKPVHDNAYVKTYALLEEMGKPISFHAAYNWNDQSLQMTNRFISVHALGFMWFNMVHMTNWVVNGLPERFPKLKVMWVESGLTWAYGLMQRLDHSYMMRTSDCPSLKRKPSEYMREMYYSSQPMEKPRDRSILEATFKMINAETQLMWSSDYPHWDFDLPSVIYDLPFLSESGRRNILGGTAAKLFGLDPKPVKKIP